MNLKRLIFNLKKRETYIWGIDKIKVLRERERIIV